MHSGTIVGFVRALLAFLILVTLVRAADAQAPRCGIRGTVIDQSGATVSWAVVKAENRVSSLAYSTVASAAGEYWLRNLPAGSYRVTAFSPGFRVLRVPATAIQAGATGVLSLKLRRAVAATTVNVIASAPNPRLAKAADSSSGDFVADLVTNQFDLQYSLCN
jgi:hypothetical protein